MALQFESLTHDAQDPARLSAFWGALLDRPVRADARGHLVEGSPTQVGLRFEASTSRKLTASAVHLHVTSEATGDQQAGVDRTVGLGARHVDVGQFPDERHVVLADPEGNEFCVIEPENNYLRGCGPLGELADPDGHEFVVVTR